MNTDGFVLFHPKAITRGGKRMLLPWNIALHIIHGKPHFPSSPCVLPREGGGVKRVTSPSSSKKGRGGGASMHSQGQSTGAGLDTRRRLFYFLKGRLK